MKYCKDCQNILVMKELSKDQIRVSRCKECYRTHEREKRRRVRRNKSEQHRRCPNCDIKHKSPGYCLEYCLDCFRVMETNRKAIWRRDNREIDTARLKRYNKSSKGIKTHTNWTRTSSRKKKAILVKENGGGCNKCGYNQNLAALSFHHLDPKSKDVDVSRLRLRSLEKLRKEVAKCVLLCIRCHQEEHHPELDKNIYPFTSL